MLTFDKSCSGLLALSSSVPEDLVKREDFLCGAGSKETNSELESKSMVLLFGVVAAVSAPPLPLLRRITILASKLSFNRSNDSQSGNILHCCLLCSQHTLDNRDGAS